MNHYWSWVLALFSVTALWIGPYNRWGWAVGFVGQGLLLVYSVATEQYGFVFSAVVVGGAYLRNFALGSQSLSSQSLSSKSPGSQSSDNARQGLERTHSFYSRIKPKGG